MRDWPLGILLALLLVDVMTVRSVLARLRLAMQQDGWAPIVLSGVLLLANWWAGVLIMEAILRQL